MANVLLGHWSHPLWSDLVASAERHGSFGESLEVTPDDRVVVLVGYGDLADIEAHVARLADLHQAEVLLVAPDMPESSPLGRGLAATRALLPRSRRLCHAPPIEVVLEVRDDIRQSRMLSLSASERPVPFVAWRDVAAHTRSPGGRARTRARSTTSSCPDPRRSTDRCSPRSSRT